MCVCVCDILFILRVCVSKQSCVTSSLNNLVNSSRPPGTHHGFHLQKQAKLPKQSKTHRNWDPMCKLCTETKSTGFSLMKLKIITSFFEEKKNPTKNDNSKYCRQRQRGRACKKLQLLNDWRACDTLPLPQIAVYQTNQIGRQVTDFNLLFWLVDVT